MSQDPMLRLPGAVKLLSKTGEKPAGTGQEEKLYEEVTVKIKLSHQQLTAWLTGKVDNVVAKSTDNRKVYFPVHVLRPFMQRHGVEGTFVIEYSLEGKFLSIKQVW